MKFGVVIFPGSNCDRDLIHVVKNNMKKEVVELWHKDHNLQGCDFILLPGGFSYGDYLRSGAIARFSPLMQEIIEFADKGGFVFGICNGFQVLCESGLLPGVLMRNSGQKFICKNVHIKAMTKKSAITAHLDLKKALQIPIAHAEGRYYADEKTLDALENNNQVLFKYCTTEVKLNAEANPKGSRRNIVSISKDIRNIYGSM